MRVSVRPLDADAMVGDERVTMGATRELEVGDSVTVTRVTDPVTPAEPTDDAFAPTNRPNGPMTAEIAPKMPKSGGELAQVLEGDRFVERAVAADPGVAVQGGGPETKDGTTPGPQPEAVPAGGASGPVSRMATGDIDATGAPKEAGEAARHLSGPTKSTRATGARTSTTRKSRK